MDVLRFLTEGNKEPNPLYNSKTKKGATQPPFITNSNPGQDLRDRIISATTKTSNINAYSLVGYNPEEYSDYDVYINPWDTKEELDRQRAKNQGIFEQGVRAIGQTINEIGLGTIIGTLDLASIAIDAIKNGNLKYERPELVQQLADFKEGINESIAIYRENPNAAFDITDTGWWFSNMPTIASSITLMVPGLGVSKGLSTLGKIGILSTTANKAANILKLSEKTRQFLGRAGESISAGATMRLLENYQEATQVKQDAKDYANKQLASMDNKQRAEFYKNNPQYKGKTDEEIADDIATNAAGTTFAEDWWNVMFDIYQVYSLKNMWSKALQGTNTTRLRNINRQAAAQFGDDAAAIQEKIANKTFGEKALDYIKNAGSAAAEGVRTEWTEGIEEAVNYIAQQDGMQIAKYAFDKSTPETTIGEYLKDPHLWESAFWGVLAGVAFSSIGDAAVGLAQRKLNKDFINAEKQKENEIYRRNDRFNNYKDKIDKIASGINPYVINVDASGNKQNSDTKTEEEKELLRNIAKEEYFEDMIIDAIDNGNLELLEGYATDANVTKGFKEKLNLNEEEATNLQNDFINQIQTVKNKYSNVFKMVNDAGGNYQVGSIIAKEALKRERSSKLNNLLVSHNEQELNLLKTTAGIDISAEDREAIQKLNYYYRLDRINKQIELINADAAINKLEKEIRLKKLEEYKKRLEENEPINYKNEEGEFDVISNFNKVNKLKKDYPDIYNSLWNIADTNLNIALERNDNYLSTANIKKEVKRYNDLFKQYSDKAVTNAFNKRNQLYEKYGELLGTDAMTEEDRKSYNEVSDILNAAGISQEDILREEKIIDNKKKIQELYEQNQSEEILNNQVANEESAMPLEEEQTNTSETTQSSTGSVQQSEPEVSAKPTQSINTTEDTKAEEDNLNNLFGVNSAVSTTTENAEVKPPVKDGTVETKPTPATPSNDSIDTSFAEDYNQIFNYINDKFTDLTEEQLTDINYLNSIKSTIIEELVNHGVSQEIAEQTVNEQISFITGDFNIDTNDDNLLFSSLDYDAAKRMLINASLASARKKRTSSNKNVEAIIEEFVNSKNENGATRGVIVNGKYYFSVENLIDYIYQISGSEVIRTNLFDIIRNYINSKNNSKYVFVDNEKLLSLTGQEFADRIRTNAEKRKLFIKQQRPNNVAIDIFNDVEMGTKQYEAFVKLNEGDKVTSHYDGNANRIMLYAGTGKNKQYIGYLGVPLYDERTGSYIAHNKGWYYDVAHNENGDVASRIKNFFISLFDNSYIHDDLYSFIYANSDELTETEIFSLYDKIIKAGGDNFIYTADNTDITEEELIYERMMHLKRVFSRAITDGDYKASINNWFEQLAYSYDQAAAVVIDKEIGNFVVTSGGKGNVLLSENYDQYIDEVLEDYSSDKYPLFSVIDNGVVQFANELQPTSLSRFSKGITALSIPNGLGGFNVAQTTQIPIGDNHELIKQAKYTLYYSISDYINGKISHDEILNIANSLFGDIGLFKGKYHVISTSYKGRPIISFGVNNNYLFTINGSTTDKSANVAFKDGTSNKYVDINNSKDKLSSIVGNLINVLFKDATIAIPFNLINDKVKRTDNHSRYYRREGNKTIIEIGSYRSETDSYQDFLIKNRFIKTKLKKATPEDGIASGIYKYDGKASLNVVFKTTIEEDSKELSTPVNLDNINLNEGNTYESLKKEFEGNENITKYIDTIHKLGLLPDNLIITSREDTEANKIYGWYDPKNKTINLNANRISGMNYRNLIRTIVHESLHYQLDNMYDKDKVLNDLKIVYDKFVKYLEDNKDRLKANKFQDTNSYDELIKFTNRGGDNLQVNIEEFIVESLTNGMLIDALNNIKYGKKEIRMSGIKSLLHELLIAVARALGITVKRDSLLYEELSIISHIRNFDELAVRAKADKPKLPVEDETNITIEYTADNNQSTTAPIDIVQLDDTTNDYNDSYNDNNYNNDNNYIDDIIESTLEDTSFTNNLVTLKSDLPTSLQANFDHLLSTGAISMYCE